MKTVGVQVDVGSTSVSFVMHADEYPGPPEHFPLSRIAGALSRRYRSYRNGKEKLPALAYYCLDRIEKEAWDDQEKKKRERASDCFNIEKEVLNDIGHFSTRKGDASHARKHNPDGIEPYTNKQQGWLDAAVRALILQVARVEAREDPPQLTMTDLPSR